MVAKRKKRVHGIMASNTGLGGGIIIVAFGEQSIAVN